MVLHHLWVSNSTSLTHECCKFLIIAPHQPRLDWQMWFAALGSYQHDPWIIHLMYRLLIGQKEGGC